MNKNQEEIMTTVSFDDFTAVCGDFKLKGISPILDVPMSYDIDAMFKGWNLSETPSDWVFAGLLGGSLRIKGFAIHCGLDVSGKSAPYITMKNNAGEDVKLYKSSKVKDLPANSENKAKVILETLESAPTWLSYLIACVQTKPLAAKSIMSFFISLKVDVPNLTHTKRFLDYISPLMPTLMEKPAFREIALGNRFMQYHTSVCSTPTLAKRVIEDLKDLASSFFTDSDVRYIADAYLHFWDMDKANLIPQRAIAITMAYLRASKSEPEKWYQGEKAADTMGGAFMREYKETFELILERSANTRDLKEAKDFKELTEKIRESKPEAKGFTPIDEVFRQLKAEKPGGLPPSGPSGDGTGVFDTISHYANNVIPKDDQKRYRSLAKMIKPDKSGMPSELKEVLSGNREVTDYDVFLCNRFIADVADENTRTALANKVKAYIADADDE
nr:MAG: hypothetical protein [brine shrimp yue-like virus 8]